jgi:hypothetical protein
MASKQQNHTLDPRNSYGEQPSNAQPEASQMSLQAHCEPPSSPVLQFSHQRTTDGGIADRGID